MKSKKNNKNSPVLDTITPIPQPPMANTKSNPNDKNTKDTDSKR